MKFSQSFRLALKSLLTSKMRSLLTMLGIIIGVAAVIVITSLGNGMQQMMNDQFDKLGANLIQVQVWGRENDSRSVTPADMYALQAKYPQYITGVSPYVNAQTTIRYQGEEYKRTQVYGTYAFLKNKGSAAKSIGVQGLSAPGTTPGGNASGLELGIRHFF